MRGINSMKKKNLVFFQSNEKHMADRMRGCPYRKSGAPNFERSPLSLKYHKTKDLKLFLL